MEYFFKADVVPSSQVIFHCKNVWIQQTDTNI